MADRCESCGHEDNMPSMDELRASSVDARVARLRADLERAVKSSLRGRIAWWLSERIKR